VVFHVYSEVQLSHEDDPDSTATKA
jgi:hypothetical protein